MLARRIIADSLVRLEQPNRICSPLLNRVIICGRFGPQMDTEKGKRMETNEITQKIIGCVYTVSNTLGGGFAEKVYDLFSSVFICG